MTIHQAKVSKTWAETDTLTGVLLEVSDEARAQHQHPGQIIVVKAGEKKVYLALASEPGAAQLELLVAPGGVEQAGIKQGATLEIEGPMGKGFPMEPAEGKDVLLFAVGSALAPIRPIIEMIRKNRSDYGRVNLFVGALSEEAFAYRSEYEAWRRDRIDVTTAIERPWVQEVFAEDPLALDDAVAYVCGMNEMMDGVTETLVKFGLPAEKVFRNW